MQLRTNPALDTAVRLAERQISSDPVDLLSHKLSRRPALVQYDGGDLVRSSCAKECLASACAASGRLGTQAVTSTWIYGPGRGTDTLLDRAAVSWSSNDH